jgi:gluconate 2-dehydrogenase gamma chain
MSHDQTRPRRRDLLSTLAVGVPTVIAGLASGSRTGDAENIKPAGGVEPPESSKGREPWLILTSDEVSALTAVMGRLIPSDSLGPGASDSGGVAFIDRQMASAYGAGDHFYSMGPFAPGAASQGYQLSFTPSQMFRIGLEKLQNHIGAGQSFADLAVADQDDLLSKMENGEIDLSPVPSAAFFGNLLSWTQQSFFADPMYGGNKNKVGWVLVGFPGAYSSYSEYVEDYGMNWQYPPTSIAEDQDMVMPNPNRGDAQ